MKRHQAYWLIAALAANPAATAIEKVHSSDAVIFNNSLSPDGKKLYFTEVRPQGPGPRLMQARVENGKATDAAPLRIGGQEVLGSDITVSPDGQQLLYSGYTERGEVKGFDLYVIHKQDGQWQPPVLLPTTVNSASDEFYPSLTANGDLYFARRISGENLDLFVSRNVNGQYLTPRRLPDTVNTNLLEGDGFVTPDGNTLVFVRKDAKDGVGMTDMYISYQTETGWSEAHNLGPAINTQGIDGSPFVTRDGQWLYFTSNRDSPTPAQFDNQLALYRVAVTRFP